MNTSKHNLPPGVRQSDLDDRPEPCGAAMRRSCRTVLVHDAVRAIDSVVDRLTLEDSAKYAALIDKLGEAASLVEVVANQLRD